jgi:cell division protein FtsL
MLAQIDWGSATGIGLGIFAAVCTVIGGVWKLATDLSRIEGKVDVVQSHIEDHCDDINEIKADVKELSRSAGVEVRQQVLERRRVQARDAGRDQNK